MSDKKINFDVNKDVEDLQKLYDNPDEEFAKKNYGSVEAYKKMLNKKMSSLKKEATTTSAVASVNTPFAFSKKGIGNVRAAKMMGYKLAKLKKSNLYKNDELKETSFIDKNGLVQHNDPNMDPNLVTYKNTTMPTNENKPDEVLDQTGDGKIGVGDAVVAARKAAGMKGKKSKFYAKVRDIINNKLNNKLNEGHSSLKFEDTETNLEDENLINIQSDFSTFDQKLKSSTERIKSELQDNLNKKLAGKKVIVRSSKGYKQPESDYTVNVSNVDIDYYYDKYVIIIVGREENKQKTQRFFVKPGFKIKVLGKSNIKKASQQNDVKPKITPTPEEPENFATSTSPIENPTPESGDDEITKDSPIAINEGEFKK